jgi:hypothetical protein
MSLNEILTAGNAPANPLNVTFGIMSVAGVSITDSVIAAASLANFSGYSGMTYNPAASSFPSGGFYYAGASAVTFSLPTVASLITYLNSVGFSNSQITGGSIYFSIVNGSANAVTVTNNGDNSWSFLQSPATAIVAAHSKANFQAFFNSPTLVFLTW